MAKKKQPSTQERTDKPRNVLLLYQQQDESEDAASARTLTKPEVMAARTIQEWRGNDIEINAVVNELTAQIDVVNGGDLKRPEAMLLAQAHTLGELFNNLAKRAHRQGYMNNFETMLRLALKAQAQCTHTLKVLAEIKNPPIVYAKQANIATGHQQVNNGLPVSHTGESKNQQNELLDRNDGERLDIGKTGKQSQLIRQWQPWNKSTGANTPEGKAMSSRNAYKGNPRAMMKQLRALLREQERQLRDF